MGFTLAYAKMEQLCQVKFALNAINVVWAISSFIESPTSHFNEPGIWNKEDDLLNCGHLTTWIYSFRQNFIEYFTYKWELFCILKYNMLVTAM